MKKISIVLVLLFTLAFSTRAIANLTLGSTSVTSNGTLTLSTSSSTLVLPTTNGTNGQVLTTNGSGVTSWMTVSGGGGISGLTINTIPKATSATTVGDSGLLDDGSSISTNLVFRVDAGNGAGLNIGGPAMGNSTLGDWNFVQNHSTIVVDDPNNRITATVGATGTVALAAGSNTNEFNENTVNIIANNSINLDSKGGVTTIGDVNDSAASTKLIIDDSSSLITATQDFQFNGTIISLSGAQLSNQLIPNAAGSIPIGLATYPFSSYFVGNATNNSSRITGTFTGNRVATLPDETGIVQLSNVTAFATLPACNSTNEGMVRGVNNSNTNTWGANIAGGGANHVLAYCNGTAWTVAGK